MFSSHPICRGQSTNHPLFDIHQLTTTSTESFVLINALHDYHDYYSSFSLSLSLSLFLLINIIWYAAYYWSSSAVAATIVNCSLILITTHPLEYISPIVCLWSSIQSIHPSDDDDDDNRYKTNAVHSLSLNAYYLLKPELMQSFFFSSSSHLIMTIIRHCHHSHSLTSSYRSHPPPSSLWSSLLRRRPPSSSPHPPLPWPCYYSPSLASCHCCCRIVVAVVVDVVAVNRDAPARHPLIVSGTAAEWCTRSTVAHSRRLRRPQQLPLHWQRPAHRPRTWWFRAAPFGKLKTFLKRWEQRFTKRDLATTSTTTRTPAPTLFRMMITWFSKSHRSTQLWVLIDR